MSHAIPGISGDCKTCREIWEVTDPEVFEDLRWHGKLLDEGGISSKPCETCGDPQQGDRFSAHVLDGVDWIHCVVCEACMLAHS